MINFDQLCKSYGGRRVVDELTLSVSAGTVTGFLGPNGAGKSTALRILLGMSAPDAGTATVADRRYQSLGSPGLLVGALLDADAFHPGRTGRESLRLSCLTMGLPMRRVDEVLDLVGLTRAESRRRVRSYSLGMRQRLGLANALLGDPAVLILDEPANGLDPQGQRWLGELLRERAGQGCTVLLSSHQLAEVERIADRLAIIADGRLVAHGRPAELRASHGDITDFYFAVTSGLDRAA
ncbi:ABC transporter ATP-binding protein [Microlunatus soli]|nr:ATP-binding cassette domain-containing protein [Microlunatus soli]